MKKLMRAFALTIALICSISLFAACTTESNEDKDNGKSEAIEFYITYEGTKIELDKNADSVLDALGEAKSVTSLGDCGGIGTQTRYTYADFELYTVKNDEGEKIDQISLKNDVLETPKGICTGDSSEDVIKAYGEPTEKTESKITYEKGSLFIKFGLNDDGTVKSIDFIRLTAK